jgi:hypothetical protein
VFHPALARRNILGEKGGNWGAGSLNGDSLGMLIWEKVARPALQRDYSLVAVALDESHSQAVGAERIT